jgi:hypothetical protein
MELPAPSISAPGSTQIVGDLWPMISFIVLVLVALGGMIYVIRSLVHDVKEMKITLYNPKTTGDRLLTVAECEKCNANCKKETHEMIEDLKAEIKANGDVLCDVRVGIGILMERRKSETQRLIHDDRQ